MKKQNPDFLNDKLAVENGFHPDAIVDGVEFGPYRKNGKLWINHIGGLRKVLARKDEIEVSDFTDAMIEAAGYDVATYRRVLMEVKRKRGDIYDDLSNGHGNQSPNKR